MSQGAAVVYDLTTRGPKSSSQPDAPMKFQEPTPIQVEELKKLVSRVLKDGPKAPIPKPKRSKSKTSSLDSIPKRPSIRPTIIIAPQEREHAPDTNQQQEEVDDDHTDPEDPIDQSTPATEAQANRAANALNASRVGSEEPQQPTQLVKVFLRILRSYRQQLFQLYGGKCETIIRQAEQEVRFLNPDFSLDDLQDETAPVVLDLFEALIREASLLRRSRLREGALLLVADLYNKNYDLLDHHNLIDKVETAYYRLKR